MGWLGLRHVLVPPSRQFSVDELAAPSLPRIPTIPTATLLCATSHLFQTALPRCLGSASAEIHREWMRDFHLSSQFLDWDRSRSGVCASYIPDRHKLWLFRQHNYIAPSSRRGRITCGFRGDGSRRAFSLSMFESTSAEKTHGQKTLRLKDFRLIQYM